MTAHMFEKMLEGWTFGDFAKCLPTMLSALLEKLDAEGVATFNSQREALESIVRAQDTFAAVTLSFVHTADLHQAGRVVGVKRTEDYLVNVLGYSISRARSLVSQAREIYSPPPAPNFSVVDDEGHSETDDARTERLKQEQAQWQDQQREREKSRRQAQVSAEAREVIEAELRKLKDYALSERDTLRCQALERANVRSVDDVRLWLREQVQRANNRHRPLSTHEQHVRAHQARYIRLTKPDADGGSRLFGYLGAGQAAILREALSMKNLNSWLRADNETEIGEEGSRTYDQASADFTVAAISGMRNKENQIASRRGVGTIVISGTLDEFLGMTPDTQFETNTGDQLTAYDIALVSEAVKDFLAFHDPKTGHPLGVVPTKRLASVEQRIALIADQLVCVFPGCTAPAIYCDANHNVAWSNGGPTELSNLSLLCRNHHSCVDDTHSGKENKGHVETDPETGLASWVDAQAKRYGPNTSVVAQRSGGAKIRKKNAAEADAENQITPPGQILNLPASPPLVEVQVQEVIPPKSPPKAPTQNVLHTLSTSSRAPRRKVSKTRGSPNSGPDPPMTALF